MTISLNEDGLIDLPKSFRDEDGLRPGDCFEVRRVAMGQYLLAKQDVERKPVKVVVGEDGIARFHGGGRITSEMVRALESEPW